MHHITSQLPARFSFLTHYLRPRPRLRQELSRHRQRPRQGPRKIIWTICSICYHWSHPETFSSSVTPFHPCVNTTVYEYRSTMNVFFKCDEIFQQRFRRKTISHFSKH